MLQYFVSNAVSMGVVDLLEPIQIQVYERYRAALGGIGSNPGIDAVIERRTIQQRGQRVVLGPVGQLLV